MSAVAVAQVGKAKDGWSVQTIAEVCRLINGRAYKKKELLDEGPFRVLRVGNFFTNKHWYYSDLDLDEDKYCDDGDLLYAWSASFGPRIWSGGKVIYHYHIWKVEPDRDLIDRDYLFYFFEWDKELICAEQGAGATMIHVSKGSMEARSIPLPPLEEQKRIVAVLDQAFAALDRARANAEANLADAEELLVLQREKLLCERGGDWTETTVGKICDGFEYGTSSKSHPIGEIPVLRMGNLQNGEIDWSDLKYTDDQQDIQKYLLRDGDVLFNRTNSIEHVGKSAIYRGQQPAIFAGYLIRTNYDPEIVDPDFLNIYLGSRRAKEYGHSVMGKSVNQANISASKLKTYPISLPKLTEQKEIAAQMKSLSETVSTATAQLRSKLANIDDLRQSIIHRAFAGKLT